MRKIKYFVENIKKPPTEIMKFGNFANFVIVRLCSIGAVNVLVKSVT